MPLMTLFNWLDPLVSGDWFKKLFLGGLGAAGGAAIMGDSLDITRTAGSAARAGTAVEFGGLGAGSMVFEEGLAASFAHFFRGAGAVASEATSWYIDWLIFKDLTGARANREGFASFFGEQGPHAAIAPIKDVLQGHGFILAQLHQLAEQGSEEAAALRDTYQALGATELPDKDLLKRAYRVLSRGVHPDRKPEAEKAFYTELLQKINAANDTLKNDAKRRTFKEFTESARHSNDELKGTIEHYFASVCKLDWKEAFAGAEQCAREMRPRLAPGSGASQSRRNNGFASRIFEELEQASHLRKGAMVFGAVTGVSLLTYHSFKALEHVRTRHDRHTETSASPADTPTHAYHTRKTLAHGFMALAGLVLTGAALKGYHLQGGTPR